MEATVAITQENILLVKKLAGTFAFIIFASGLFSALILQELTNSSEKKINIFDESEVHQYSGCTIGIER